MIYRFLASLKLAVISISTLAATLAYATFFESKYGGGAVQEWIYRSPGFAIPRRRLMMCCKTAFSEGTSI